MTNILTENDDKRIELEPTWISIKRFAMNFFTISGCLLIFFTTHALQASIATVKIHDQLAEKINRAKQLAVLVTCNSFAPGSKKISDLIPTCNLLPELWHIIHSYKPMYHRAPTLWARTLQPSTTLSNAKHVLSPLLNFDNSGHDRYRRNNKTGTKMVSFTKGRSPKCPALILYDVDQENNLKEIKSFNLEKYTIKDVAINTKGTQLAVAIFDLKRVSRPSPDNFSTGNVKILDPNDSAAERELIPVNTIYSREIGIRSLCYVAQDKQLAIAGDCWFNIFEVNTGVLLAIHNDLKSNIYSIDCCDELGMMVLVRQDSDLTQNYQYWNSPLQARGFTHEQLVVLELLERAIVKRTPISSWFLAYADTLSMQDIQRVFDSFSATVCKAYGIVE